MVSAICPERLRRVHDLPAPRPAVLALVRGVVCAYAATVDVRRVDLDRSFVTSFGDRRYGVRGPDEVGYQRGASRSRR